MNESASPLPLVVERFASKCLQFSGRTNDAGRAGGLSSELELFVRAKVALVSDRNALQGLPKAFS